MLKFPRFLTTLGCQQVVPPVGFPHKTPFDRSQTLRIKLVGNLAAACTAASGAGPALATALAVHGRAARGWVGRVGRVASARAAGPDGRAGLVGVVTGAVDVEAHAWLGIIVDAGDLNRGAGFSGAGAGDLDLRAAEVELGVAAVGAMQGDVLGADEVLAGWGANGDLEVNAVLVPGAPVGVLQAV